MTPRIAAFMLAALCAPIQAGAQEAFLQQVSVGGAGVSVSLPQPQARPLDVAQLSTTLAAELTAPRPAALYGSIDLSAYPLVPAASGAAYADVSSTGNNNTVEMMQVGVHAASVLQTGNNNMAAVMQTGSGNRASVYQSGNGHSAMVSQSGRNNRALIVQN